MKTAGRFSLVPLEPYWHQTQNWWSERSVREQVLIGSLLATAIVTLLLIAVIAPLREVRAEARADIRNAALLEAQLRAGQPELVRAGKFRRGTASAIVTDSAAAAGITIQRIEPEGGDTRIELADTGFDRVMQWIATLEQSSRLRVRKAEIVSKGAPGIVSASFVVAG